MNNLDEDIKLLKEKIMALNLHILNYKKSECETSFYQTLVKERNALVDVLSELETYKKIIYYLGKEYNCTGKIEKFKDVLEWSEEWKRKEVENDG